MINMHEVAESENYESHLINKNNPHGVTAVQTGAVLGADKTVYVDASAADGGDGTLERPFNKINDALAVFPKNLGGFQANIRMAAGIYPEKVIVSGFSNGIVRFLSYESGVSVVAEVQGITISQTSMFHSVLVEFIIQSTTTGVIVENNAFAYFQQDVTIKSAQTGVRADLGGNIVFFDLVTANNCTTQGIFATNNGKIFAEDIRGTENKIGITASRGGIVTFNRRTIEGTTLYNSSLGGRIYSGSQTSIPSY